MMTLFLLVVSFTAGRYGLAQLRYLKQSPSRARRQVRSWDA